MLFNPSFGDFLSILGIQKFHEGVVFHHSCPALIEPFQFVDLSLSSAETFFSFDSLTLLFS